MLPVIAVIAAIRYLLRDAEGMGADMKESSRLPLYAIVLIVLGASAVLMDIALPKLRSRTAVAVVGAAVFFSTFFLTIQVLGGSELASVRTRLVVIGFLAVGLSTLFTLMFWKER